MKIDKTKGQRISGGADGKKAKKTTDATLFKALLDQHLNGVNNTEAVNPTQAVESVESIDPDGGPPPQLRLDGLALSEDAIENLDALSKALGNLDLDSDELEPLIAALEDELTAILDIKEQLPKDDALAQLLDRIATVAYLETEKFRRGDYQ